MSILLCSWKLSFFLWYNVQKKTSEIYQNFTNLHENDCTFTDVLNPNNLKTAEQKPCNRTMTELILKKVTIQEWNNLIVLEISSTEQKQNVTIKILGIKHVSLKWVFESSKTGALKSLVYFQKIHTVKAFSKKTFQGFKKEVHQICFPENFVEISRYLFCTTCMFNSKKSSVKYFFQGQNWTT